MQKKKILNRVLSSVLFVAILVGMLYVLSYIFQPKSNAEKDGIHYSRANGVLGEPKNTIDALFVGDSEAYHAFIPLYIWRDYGITSYAVSTPSQKLVYSLELMRKTFDKQKPKVVFLETNAIFRKSYFEDELTYKAEEIMPIIRYHDRWKNLQLKDFSSAIKYNAIVNNKGYYFITKSEPSSAKSIKKYMKYSEVTAPILSTNQKYLKEIAKFCKKNDAKLVLLSTPSTKNWNYQRHNAIEKEANKLEVDYIDLNLMRDDIPINWKKETKDKGDHLNYSGAVKVTNFMGQYLSKTGLFADKRNDPKYSDWDKCLSEFELQVAEDRTDEK